LEKLGIANLSTPTQKRKFGFLLNDILGNDVGNQTGKLETNIKTANNASLEELVKTVDRHSGNADNEHVVTRKIMTLLRLLQKLGIVNLDTPNTKGPLGFSLEDIFGKEAAKTLKNKMKTVIVETANRLDESTPNCVSRPEHLRSYLHNFGINEGELEA
jgi:hypothetical protein